MIRLQDTVLVRAELLKLSFEELRLLVRDRFLVEDENVRDVVRMDLPISVCKAACQYRITYLALQIEQYLRPLLLHQV